MTKRNQGPVPPYGRAKKLIFMGGGGGGKTTLAMLTASAAIARGIDVQVYDMDRANQSMERYFDKQLMPLENMVDRESRDPLIVPEFLEERVFSHDGNAIIDFGANLEDGLLYWLADRGGPVANDIRIICPVKKKDGVSAVNRIYANTEGIKKLLVLNLGGERYAENARATDLYQQLLEEGAQEALLPLLGHSLIRMDDLNLRPDEMLTRGMFDKQGGTNILRQVEEFYQPFPDFRIW